MDRLPCSSGHMYTPTGADVTTGALKTTDRANLWRPMFGLDCREVLQEASSGR